MKIGNLIKSAMCAGFILFSSNSYSGLMLEFIEPDGVVKSNESIPMWIRLSTDSDFFFDSLDSLNDGSYGNIGDFISIPTQSYAHEANNGQGAQLDYVSFDRVYISFSYTCSGSFTDNGCTKDGSNYHFIWSDDLYSQLNIGDTFSMMAGDVIDYKLGEYVPLNGGAEVGEYDFFRTSLSIGFQGVGIDDNFERHNMRTFRDFASTCDNQNNCAFRRTVIQAIPEPSSIALMMLSITTLLGYRRKRVTSN